jgi:hypothetical protein
MARKAKPSPITDAVILSWMNEGTLYFVEWLKPDPVCMFRGRVLLPELNQQGGRGQISGGQRYRFQLRMGGKRRRIMRSKLVWMYFFGVEVPEDCQIHHGPGGKLDDSIQNLTCMTEIQHAFWHNGPVDDVPF